MKQAIIVRNDLDISVGKLVAQACHASAKATAEAQNRGVQASGFENKVVVHTDLDGLEKKQRQAAEEEVLFVPVRDAGRTEVEPSTLTAVAIGPAPDSQVNSITGDLPLLKTEVTHHGSIDEVDE